MSSDPTPTPGSTVVAAGSSAAPSVSDAASDDEVDDLAGRAARAHEALMRGDIVRYRALIPLSDDFTLMSPFGGEPTRGGTLSDERWEAIGRFFRNGRESTLDVIQSYRTADLVVLAVVERTHVEVGGLPAQPWALRVTLVFRKEHERWLLAHRHADALANGISLEQAAALTRGSSPS